MNLTNSFQTLSNEIEDVYQTKLKTDSQNRFISSRCIFFCEEHMIKWTMVMLTRTLYGHCEDVGLTPPWRRSRRFCPAASVLTVDSHRNRRVCRAAPRRTPTIYAIATSMNTFSPQRMNTHTYTIAVYKRDTDYVFYNHRNKKLTTQKLCGTVGWATRQRKFKMAARLRRIWQNSVKSVLNEMKLTPNETWNGLLEWIHLVEMHLFHVGHIFQRSMVVVIWKTYERAV
jgi:hypothetical protein